MHVFDLVLTKAILIVIFCTQECPSSSVSTSSRVDVDLIKKQKSDGAWTRARNTLHMLSVLDKTVEGFLTDLSEDVTSTVFMLVQAGQHRAKVRHMFRDLEERFKKDPSMNDHQLQKMMREQNLDPRMLPWYSQSPWLHTTLAMIAVGLPAGVCS